MAGGQARGGSAARRAVVAAGPRVRRGAQQARRAAFLTRMRLAAAAVDATVELDVASDVSVGRRIRVELAPWTHNRLQVGAGALLGDDLLLQLKGGSLTLGRRAQLRRGSIANIAGRLVIGDDCIVSWGCVVHCSTQVVLGEMCLVGEYSTLADSSHFFTDPDHSPWHNVRSAPIEIGRGCWLGAKSTVAKGVTIGPHSIVGAGSTVTADVPAGSLASGVPAVTRALRLPWDPARRP